MQKSVTRIFLQPGELFFGERPRHVGTLLGSCVAVTLWHPQRKLGGMCHIQLPKGVGVVDDVRFADGAVKKFIEEIKRAGTKCVDYHVGIYGGGNMFPQIKQKNAMNIGDKNVAHILGMLINKGFPIHSWNMGGPYSRRIELDLVNGSIKLTNLDVRTPSRAS